GAALVDHVHVPHDTSAVAQAIGAAQATSDMILILTASATSDPLDTAPQAVRAAGGHVTHFGMPVDPGNLLFFGQIGAHPVIGLPGCARAPALNGADWVLERLICGVPVTSADIMSMGVGGLLKEIPSRPRPRDAS
ncbi:MAG: molybdopterin biosynthesis protein, partial [Paracoccaceae bacterium]